MLDVHQLLELMESQQESTSVKTIDQQTEHLADLESELVQVTRQLSVTRKNIAHYQQVAEQMLRTNPERFGAEVVKLLHNIATAKVMKDYPEIFEQLHQLEQRVEEIRKEVGQ